MGVREQYRTHFSLIQKSHPAIVAVSGLDHPRVAFYFRNGWLFSPEYAVTSQRRVLAVVGFGASAWKAAPRDRFIGWSVAQREARLQLVVNNARFLILPWVQVRNLASTVLARSSRRLPDDWQARYGYRPLLLETFVQSDRFAGTSYRAANWTHVGQTQGRGKLDVHRTHALPRKDIWLYPLRRDFRRRLCAPLDPPPHQ